MDQPVEPPNGMYPARVDDKGRLKLPVVFQEYFAALPEKKLFVTSLDRRIGHIYPIQAWRQSQKFFQEFRENPRVARNVAFNAADLGADSEVDGQGRILLPPELRRTLGVENQSVKLYAYNGHVEIYSEAVYEQRRAEAAVSPEEDLDVLQRAGLQ